MKTQIQIPDELYRRVKRLAEAQEWTLAETLRRGAELLLASRPIPRVRGEWSLAPPTNVQLTVDPFANPAWRDEANRSQSGESAERR